MLSIFKWMMGDKTRREMKKMRPIIDRINELFEEYNALTDEQLMGKTDEFRRRLGEGETLDDLLPEAFAAVKQACKRKAGQTWVAGGTEITWDMVPYDVQLIGGMVLHQGKISEMATGEGKTLVAILPLYLNALEGRGCHLVTVNDYLARRDSEWNGPIFAALGMRVGVIVTDMTPEERRYSYASDVTYGTNNEFGFDYLRENMAVRPEYLVQNSACWQSEAIHPELKAWAEANQAGLVLGLPYSVTLDVERDRVDDFVSKFRGLFGVDSISVAIPEEDPALMRVKLGDQADRIKDLETGVPRIEPGHAHVRIDFIRHGHHFAIVDEVDSVLIDEARTPLIISAAVDRSTHRFDTLRPLVSELVHKQSLMLNRIANEAGKELEENPESYEAAMKLFQCQLGGPKIKRFLKIRTEPRIQRMIQKVEYDHILFKKNARGGKAERDDPMWKIEEELFYVLDEKGHSIDLTESGRATLMPEDPDYFVLNDVVDETERIESRFFPEIQTVFEGDELRPEEIDRLVKKLEDEGKSLNVDYAPFLKRIRSNEDFTPEELEAFRLHLDEGAAALKAQMREQHEVKAEELHNISQLLRAYSLFEKDVEYVVQDNKVIIVDEFTGRLQPGRRYSDGLHQALEAKENVHIEKETQTLATVTLQNYFRMYKKLAGMTGTAETEASEFAHTYKMEVVVIPTNRPVVRDDMDDVIYRTRREKYNAILDEVERLHKLNLPILVGTVNVEVSETLSRMLRRRGISHNVLNAKYHAKEAEIVRFAGQPGQVTIATNMAGRGTDIKLGPGVKETRTFTGADEKEAEWPGGLQIVGTERHDARRIDRQLRGRSGRQGDPGVSRFFLSLEDDLMRKFSSDRIAVVMQKLGMEEGEDITHPFVTKAISRAQRRVEEWNFEIRKRTLEYDDVMNKQRMAIYGLRRQVLEGIDIKNAVMNISYDAMEKEIRDYADEDTPKEFATGDIPAFQHWLAKSVQGIDLDGIDYRQYDAADEFITDIMPRLEKAYDEKTAVFGPQLQIDIGRYLILRTIDENWRNHLLAIDELREGIHLRSYGQLNPLYEYQREATVMFEEMMDTINTEVFTHIYNASLVRSPDGSGAVNISFVKEEVSTAPEPPPPGPESGESGADDGSGDDGGRESVGRGQAGRGGAATAAMPRRPKGQTIRRDAKKVGPNDTCPCGSGKKYKKCCGAPGAQMGFE